MKVEKSQSNIFLLSELQKGQENAFDFIFRKYYKVLCVQANTYVNDLDKAQSLVQECFMKLWENRYDIKKIDNLSGYLSVMVRNKCIDYMRRVKLTERLNEKIEIKLQNSDTEDFLLTHEFEERLLKALSLLPERSRLAFEYSRFEKLTYKKIAEKMGISGKAVEALLSRALKILRKELKDYVTLIFIFVSLYTFKLISVSFLLPFEEISIRNF
jgi:RNA polymerase sigma-70 factor (ECF subfamily)